MAQLQSGGWSDRVVRALKGRPWLIVIMVCFFVVGAGVVVGAAVLGTQASTGVLIERNNEGVAREDADGSSVADDANTSTEGDSEGDDSTRGEAKTPAHVVVDVDGAVAVPQVVELPEGARVADALAAAGGTTDDADLSSINRAALVSDGEKIYIPRVGEDAGGGVAASIGGSAASESGVASSALININRATEAELDTLPGVGPATAAAIVEDREANGPFSSPDDLMRVSGIGEKKYEKLAGLICV